MACIVREVDSCWYELRRRLRWSLIREVETGRVDPWVLPLLSLLWSLGYATTSSCAGRITVKEAEEPWTKKGSKLVFKTHMPLDDVYSAASGILEAIRGCKGVAWLAVEPPFVTTYAPDEEEADILAALAVDAGFKYSGYRRSSCGYYVVVRGEERAEAILCIRGRLLTDRDTLAELLSLANRLLARGRDRLAALMSRLEKLSEGV